MSGGPGVGGSSEAGGAAPRAGAPALTHCLLLSGGLDSTTLAAWVMDQHPGEAVKAYTFLYGQKHAVELEAAKKVAAHFGMEHFLIELAPIKGSALTDTDRDLPEGRDLAAVTGVAPSYVPARNLLFLAQMASLQDALGPAVPVAGRPSRRLHRLPGLPP